MSTSLSNLKNFLNFIPKIFVPWIFSLSIAHPQNLTSQSVLNSPTQSLLCLNRCSVGAESWSTHSIGAQLTHSIGVISESVLNSLNRCLFLPFSPFIFSTFFQVSSVPFPGYDFFFFCLFKNLFIKFSAFLLIEVFFCVLISWFFNHVWFMD
jgi:hypothetical protein